MPVAGLPRLALALGLIGLPGSCVPPAETVAAPAATTRAAVAAQSPAASPPIRTDVRLFGGPEQGKALLGEAPTGTRTLTLDGVSVPLAADGAFLIAFDRDAAGTARLVATLDGGRQIVRDLTVAPGQWRIEHVDAPLRGGAASDADFAARRPAELAAIAAARQVAADSDGWRQHFRWPVTGRRSGFFGAQRIYRGTPASYHSGADIAVPAGTPFVAPADGVVMLAATSPFTLEGNLLIVDHGMGLNSAFLHCQRLDVQVGDRVRQGQQLGLVGQSGRATGPHLHWGMKWRDARIDPAKLAGPMGE